MTISASNAADRLERIRNFVQPFIDLHEEVKKYGSLDGALDEAKRRLRDIEAKANKTIEDANKAAENTAAQAQKDADNIIVDAGRQRDKIILDANKEASETIAKAQAEVPDKDEIRALKLEYESLKAEVVKMRDAHRRTAEAWDEAKGELSRVQDLHENFLAKVGAR